MKLRGGLSPELVAFIDRYRQQHGLESRSEVLQHALSQLQERELEEAYRAAGEEWQGSEDTALWNRVSRDGL